MQDAIAVPVGFAAGFYLSLHFQEMVVRIHAPESTVWNTKKWSHQ